MGKHPGQPRQRRGVVVTAVGTTGYRQAIGSEDGVVERIAHSLNLQSSAVTLSDTVPTRLSGYGNYSHNAAQQRNKKQNKLFHLYLVTVNVMNNCLSKKNRNLNELRLNFERLSYLMTGGLTEPAP